MIKIALISISFIFLSFNVIAQTDTNLIWVFRQAELTQKLLSKYHYLPVKDKYQNLIDTSDFELKVCSKVYGTYLIKGRIIMNVLKNKNLLDYNYKKVRKEQIMLILNDEKSEYFMVYLYHLVDGSVHPVWFRYLFSEAKMMYDSLKDIVN